MTQDTDPVGNTFVASLARPGGNITGLSSFSGVERQTTGAFQGDRISALPLSRIGDSTYPGNTQALRETELAAGAFEGKASIPRHTGIRRISSCFRAANKRAC